MADVADEESTENAVPQTKLVPKQDNPPKLNGLDIEENMVVNGNVDDHPDDGEQMEVDTSENDTTEHQTNGEDDKIIEDSTSVKTPDNDSTSVKSPDNESDVDKNPDIEDVKSVEKTNGSVHEDENASPKEENSGEAMETYSKDDDNDSNVVEVSSNISAQDAIDIDPNSSRNPSVVSEENSRDSIDSNASVKSMESTQSNPKDGLVSKVKVDGDEEILITLNEDEEGENKEEDETGDSKDVEMESESVDTDKKTDSEEPSEVDQKKDVEVDKETVKETVKTVSSTPTVVATTATAVPNNTAPKATSLLAQSTPVSSFLIPTTGVTFPMLNSQNVLIPGAPAGIQLIRQGHQLGYVTVNGNQRIFVPVTGVQVQGPANSVIASQLNTSGTTVQHSSQSTKVQPQTITLEELKPKSSMETIELMKWEVQNRVADNYNWSVAFHPRREELSSISHFLQELGSDVVKEQVYKDIIQIQTKKKDNGDLKDAEVESLEKMKTVYENTKKKVEHLQLETKECEQCKFRTESSVVMNFHEDFPHYDPPWDVTKGSMECSHCNFRTKVAPQFIFHMKDIHKAQAKFMEKTHPFQCSLCPLNAASKNKLERHQGKCTKHFKLNSNLQPYYHDVNFCMKTCYYKPKKPAPPPPPKPAPKAAPTVNTRQQAGQLPVQQVTISQPTIRSAVPQSRLRPVLKSPYAPAPAHRQVLNVPNRPRLQPPALQRAPVSQPQQQKPTRPPGREMAGFEVCELCGGYVKDRQALRIHFYYAHKVEMPQAIFNRPSAPLTCEICKEHFWTTQGLTKHKTARRHFSQGVTPQGLAGKIVSEQECFMCMKRYPNLFVHFERVHGMTMKDLILVRKCIMCGASTNDYKSLETHLVSAHGVMIRVTDYITDKKKPFKPSPTPIISGGKNVGKINYCVFCQIQFTDNIQLTMHCIQIHATCETCGMVVSSSKHLTGHSCRKAHINKLCYICGTKVASQEKYAIHLRSHVKPCRVELNNLGDDEIANIKEKIKREYKPAVISLDSDEDSDIEVVETKPGKMKVTLEKDAVETVDLSEESKDDKNEKKIEGNDEENNDFESKIEITDVKTLAVDTEDKNESDKDKISEIKEGENEIKQDEKTESKEDEKTENKEKNTENQDDTENKEDENTEKKDENTENQTESTENNEDEITENKDDDTEMKSDEVKDDDEAEVMEESTEKSKDVEHVIDTKEEDLNDSEENVTNDSKEKVSNESENEPKTETALDENELLKSDEDSNISSGERKRKKSESDVDEDELLRESDESSSKRLKLDEDVDVNVADNVYKESNSDDKTDNAGDKVEGMECDNATDAIKEDETS